MRVEKSGNSGFACVRDFLRSGLLEQVVTLPAADRRDVLDFECPSEPQTVRLVRHIAPNGQVRVLMTNLFDVARFPACSFGDLYHQRWRIEEALKRAHADALAPVDQLARGPFQVRAVSRLIST